MLPSRPNGMQISALPTPKATKPYVSRRPTIHEHATPVRAAKRRHHRHWAIHKKIRGSAPDGSPDVRVVATWNNSSLLIASTCVRYGLGCCAIEPLDIHSVTVVGRAGIGGAA